MWFKGILALAVVALPTSAMAADRVVETSSVAGVAALLREAGYKAEIKQDKEGNGYIQSAASGNDFQLLFYGCKKDVGCDSYEFYSWYKKEPFFSPVLANEWNLNKRFLKVAIDGDGDLAEYLYVSAVGKTTYANFVDQIDWYTSMDSELFTFLKERRPKAPEAAKAPAPKT